MTLIPLERSGAGLAGGRAKKCKEGRLSGYRYPLEVSEGSDNEKTLPRPLLLQTRRFNFETQFPGR